VPAQDSSSPSPVWHGTSEEMRRLNAAAQQHCDCTTGMFGNVAEICSTHRMLADQRVLDHLLYVWRARARFEQAEWRGMVEAWDDTTASGRSSGRG
jgi:hypothetical protein